jgi:hypothetical protein
VSKDKIEVNMNVYDIPILVETLEKINKENTILRQNSQYLVKQKDELEEVINKAIEYIEYYFAKGRTKNHKQFDLSLYEILTGKNLFNLTMEEIEQFFKGVDKE